MKYFRTKFIFVALLAVVAAGAATVGAFADAHLRVAGGIYGVEAGSNLSATLVCLDKEKNIASGVTIKTRMTPMSDGGHTGTGVSVSCPP
ncbi:MAG TPA: hypothetical protein VMF11_04515 [Candidatus Baltobacteraceae bacterium]|nr:hypothetical protein [Candidatus Baltobacteraceae bacterium]